MFDIAAQFAAMRDPENPKDAVFIAAGNSAQVPLGYSAPFIVHRPEGVLFTTNADKAAWFQAGADDDAMASILGYPQTKSSVLSSATPKEGMAVQVRSASGAVVMDAVASSDRLYQAIEAMRPYVPPGGEIVAIHPIDMQDRRWRLLARETPEP